MEFSVLKRDVKTVERRRHILLGPDNKQSHLKLFRYQVTEEKLREVRSLLSHRDCGIKRITVHHVTFNDKKAKLLAKGISLNDTINEVEIIKCKIKVNQMELLTRAIGTNESIETLLFENTSVLERHGFALGQALSQNVSLKHLTLIGCGIGDLAMI